MGPLSMEERLDELEERWEAMRAVGRDLTAEELCEECPELAPLLEARIAPLRLWADAQARDTAPAKSLALVSGRPTQEQALERQQSLGLFDRYEIIEKIGGGGMGDVYKSRHATMKRIVAIKTLPANALNSPEKVRQFEREIHAVSRLDHPNIVTTHDAVNTADAHFLVMQFIEGKNLAAVVEEEGPLPVGRAVAYVRQAAQGARTRPCQADHPPRHQTLQSHARG